MNKLKTTIGMLLIASLAITGSKSDQKRDGLIGNHTAIFYPNDFNAAANLPSLAFEKEPVRTGDLPATWKFEIGRAHV